MSGEGHGDIERGRWLDLERGGARKRKWNELLQQLMGVTPLRLNLADETGWQPYMTRGEAALSPGFSLPI